MNPGLFATYNWNNNRTEPTITVSRAGRYSVAITTAEGCIGSDTIVVKDDCTEIVFPTAFTPNGDGRNDFFRPLGTLSTISNYKLVIYNRWGQAVFQTTNPYDAWDGKSGGLEQGSNVFVWIAEYSFNQQPRKIQKGTIVLLK